MATRGYKNPRIAGGERVIIQGSFAPNAALQPVAASNKGVDFSVAWISTGLFRITFIDSFPDMESMTLSISMSAATDVVAQLASVYSSVTRQVDIRILAVAAVTDIAANAANRVNFQAVFKNTGAVR